MKPKLGAFLAIFSASTFGAMSFLVHWNPSGHPPGQLIFIRGIISLGILLPLHFREVKKYFQPESKYLWIRSLTGSIGVLCYFYILQGTISANANFIYSSSPIFVTLLAWIFFKEKISSRELGGIAVVVFANILLYIPNRGQIAPWVWMVGFTGAFFASFAFLSIGAAIKTYSSSLIVIGFAFSSTLLALAFPEKHWLPIEYKDLLFLGSVGILGLVSQLAATLSFAHLKSPIATTLGRTSLLFSGLLDIFAAGYRPYALEWISYLIVLLGVYLSVSKKRPAPVKISI